MNKKIPFPDLSRTSRAQLEDSVAVCRSDKNISMRFAGVQSENKRGISKETIHTVGLEYE
jgi:hypothetical protein